MRDLVAWLLQSLSETRGMLALKELRLMFFSQLLIGLITSLKAMMAVAQTCMPPPPGMIGWWPGDGNSSDLKGGNNGMLQDGATFGSGEVSQAFSFPSAGSVALPYAAVQTPAAITVDAWVNPVSTVGGASIVNWRPIADGIFSSLVPGKFSLSPWIKKSQSGHSGSNRSDRAFDRSNCSALTTGSSLMISNNQRQVS